MPALFVAQTVHTMWSKEAKTGNLYNVNFKNIKVTTEDGRVPPSWVASKAEGSVVSGVHFENITVNGQRFTDFEALNLKIGNGAQDVTIK